MAPIGDITTWLDTRLADAGIARTGAVELVRSRAWATIYKATTSAGTVWMKAAGEGTAFEAGLYRLLAQVVPERVLVPIAVDAGRGWLLLPDGGLELADRVDGAELTGALAVILRCYAELQRALAPHATAVLAAGVADMRPAVMPERYEEALASVGDFPDRDRVVAMRDTYRGWCETLAGAAGEASVDHNDLHPWNMLVGDLRRPGDVRFYDWGDAVLAHPFACLLVPLGMANRRGGAAALTPLRDAYLDAYADLAPRDELARTAALACRVAKVARALTWHRAVSGSDPGDLEPAFVAAPGECLRSLLDDAYAGGA